MISTNRDDYDKETEVRLIMPIRVGDRSYSPAFYKPGDLPDYAYKRKLVYQYADIEPVKNPPQNPPIKTIQPPQ